jgi:exodeoxyribonuclease V alpha subunit
MSRVAQKASWLLGELHARKALSELDLHLLDSLARHYGDGLENMDEALQLALALTSRAVQDSHVCLDLADGADDATQPAWPVGQPWWPWSPAQERDEATTRPDDDAAARAAFARCRALWADAARFRALIGPCPALVGPPAGDAPFVLDETRLYLRRYWQYENAVARQLTAMARAESAVAAPLDASLAAELNAQQLDAVQRALTRRLCVISGGPGTGKTYTAARILALLAGRPGQALRVRTAAPTGKAAARMEESLRQAAGGRPRPIATTMPAACTIERLLGYRVGSPYFRYRAGRPLPADVILIDEASMIDLPKMAKLLDALLPDARLILLGDMHQLASVQPGSVLGEICRCVALGDCVVELTESRRFGSQSAIGRLSVAVNRAHDPVAAQRAWRLLNEAPVTGAAEGGLACRPVPDGLRLENGRIHPAFAGAVLRGYRPLLAAATPAAAFDALAEFRVLCALRHGPYGAQTVNRLIEKALALEGVDVAESAAGLSGAKPLRLAQEFYERRVLMVVRNDYGLGLFNGDIGVALPDANDGGRMKVYFEKSATEAGERRFQAVAPRLLPAHETAFAMTIHKAQGSEFDTALMLLPRRESPVLTRETVYTGLTRVKRQIAVWTDEAVFTDAIGKTVRRFSGLRRQMEKQSSDFLTSQENDLAHF